MKTILLKNLGVMNEKGVGVVLTDDDLLKFQNIIFAALKDIGHSESEKEFDAKVKKYSCGDEALEKYIRGMLAPGKIIFEEDIMKGAGLITENLVHNFINTKGK